MATREEMETMSSIRLAELKKQYDRIKRRVYDHYLDEIEQSGEDWDEIRRVKKTFKKHWPDIDFDAPKKAS